jgi:hypothetical protein
MSLERVPPRVVRPTTMRCRSTVLGIRPLPPLSSSPEAKHRFEDLRCREGQYPLGLQVMEEQAALMALRDPDLPGTDICQAYMLGGLQIAMEW